MSAKLVLIDTSAWIEYLKKTSHPITREIESALILNVAATCQLVLAELIHSAAFKPRPLGRGKIAPLSVSILSKPRSLDRGVEGLIQGARSEK